MGGHVSTSTFPSKSFLAAVGALSLTAASLISGPAAYAQKAGGACKTVGQTAGQLKCTKVGKSNKWVRVAAAPATTAVPVTTPAPATTAAVAPTGPASFPTTGDAPGVTDSTVKIGVISVVNRGRSSAVSTNVGDETAQIQAIVKYINSTGGIAGRDVVPVIKEINVAGNTFVQAAAICAALTDDEKVFAVILQGHTFLNERECYAKKKTLVIDSSNVSFLDEEYAKLKPFLFSTSVPSINRWVPALLNEAKARGSLNNVKLGVFALDTPAERKLIEGFLAAELKKVGVNEFEAGYSGFDTPVTFFTDSAKAITRFQAKGVNTVLFMGQQGLGVAFALTAEQARFFPKYITHSNETPRFMEDIPRGPGLQPLQPGTLKDAWGIGWTPYQDTDDVGNAFPQPGAEATCISAYRVNGVAFGSRNLARYALGFCDGFFFLQAAAKPLKNLNIQAVAASAAQLKNFDLPGGYGAGGFGSSRFDGSGFYRVFSFDEKCGRIADADGNPKAPPSGGCWRHETAPKAFAA
jgi:hypothetical protein